MQYHLIEPEALEPIDSPMALDWAHTWSTETAAMVDPKLKHRIRTVLDTDDRIAYVTRRGEFLYNFWRDADHPRGLWRRTTLDSYLSGDTDWEVLLDIDALAAEENENWVWKGTHVRVEQDRALVELSRGGADAVEIREFDLGTLSFIADGFQVAEAKTQISWVDLDTVLVCTDFGDGALTASGYPARAHLWRRGEPLATSTEFFAGLVDDMMVQAWADTHPDFRNKFVTRVLDFYRKQTFIETDSGLTHIEVPEDCEVFVARGFLFVLPRSGFAGVAPGGLGVMDCAEFLAGQRDFSVLFSPDDSSSVQSISLSESEVFITVLSDVTSKIFRLPLGRWDQPVTQVSLPDDVTAQVVATDPFSPEVWIQASSFVQPDTLYRLTDELTPVRSAPALFDATGLSTRQHYAVSADGTTIPYFITGDFSTATPRPTLVYAYGGFEVSLVPGYSAVRGLAWLEHGFFYVQANLRGGGEFGPKWHEQATKTNRMRVFEDHQAVLRDIVARGYARSDQLAIRGGSNGGLLSAVALTSYPELFAAAVIQVPLCDMLRYHTWLAGASWMAEYGDPAVGAQRAVLEKYSPLHNVDKQADRPYPPALITTSTRDDRVHPAHARLFARALAAAGQPVDYYENSEGGHAGAADNDQTATVEALVYNWLYQLVH